MDTALTQRRCVACRGDMPILTAEEIATLRAQLDPDWRVAGGNRLERTYRVADFNAAVAFVNAITPIIDAEDHHPELTVSWGRVRVALWTHVNDALTENDFILAAKFDAAHARRQAAD